MIQYDKTDLEHAFLVDEANSLRNAQFIEKLQYNVIHKNLTSLKSQKNILIRIGFFVLGSFLYSSICGFISLIAIDSFDENYKFLVYLFAIIGFIGTEFLTKQKFYGYGLDDAFMIGSQLYLALAVGISTDGNELAIALSITISSLLSYLRYVQVPMAVLFSLSASASIIYMMFELGTIGETILPFVMMAFAIAGYLCSKSILKKLSKPFYTKGLVLVSSFSLILFYLSGNYLVVRELSVALLAADVAPNSDIPFAFFFYAFTFIVPVGFLVYSLVKKDRIMLWIGLLSLAFSIYTIRFYYSILPIETVLTIGGLFLFAFTYFAIKRIKNNTTGITFQPDRFTPANAIGNAEALITSQVGLNPEIKTPQSPMEFGGGDFSGGGSGGSY
ncbi:MAG: hypothetical protein KA463_00605 [Flavobacterium sp.]|nr:hypothetical protein [Flavobacterium sp.]